MTMPPSIALALGFRARVMHELHYMNADPRRFCMCPACVCYYALLDGIRR